MAYMRADWDLCSLPQNVIQVYKRCRGLALNWASDTISIRPPELSNAKIYNNYRCLDGDFDV
jgi:hypothetical protein